MSDLSLFRSFVQRITPPDYAPGYSVPNTEDNQSDAIAETQQGAVESNDHGAVSSTYATRGLVKFALTGMPNDFGWRLQNRMEIGAARETCCAVTIAAGGTVELDPNLATVWHIVAEGAFTLGIAESEGYDPPDPNAPAPSVCVPIVVWVSLPAGAAVNFSADFLWDSSLTAATFTAPATERTDGYVFCHVPGLGWMAHVAAQGYKTQAEF